MGLWRREDNQEIGSLSDASGYGHLTNPIIESCRADVDPEARHSCLSGSQAKDMELLYSIEQRSYSSDTADICVDV